MNTNTPRERLERVLATLTPDEALHLYRALPGFLTTAKWPQLTEGYSDEGGTVWQCPRCKAEGIPEDAIYAVDVAERWTSPSDYMDGELHFWYDGNGDYEGLFYICQQCTYPVRLPDGVHEVTD